MPVKHPLAARVPAALFAALVLLAGPAFFDTGVAPSRLERPAGGSESVLAVGSGLLRAAAVDRTELLRDWARRDKRGPFGLTSPAVPLAVLLWLLLAGRQLITIRPAGRSLRGIARSFAARSPPLLRPA